MRWTTITSASAFSAAACGGSIGGKSRARSIPIRCCIRRKNPNTYTNSYSKLGSRGSHGCVRMMVPDARWVYYHIAPGTTVDIIRGEKDDAEAAAIKEQLVFVDKPDKRPGLVSGEYPVTEAWPGWQGNAYENYQAYMETLAAEAAETQESEDAQDANA